MSTKQNEVDGQQTQEPPRDPVEGRMFLYAANVMLVEDGRDFYLIGTIVFDDDRYSIGNCIEQMNESTRQIEFTFGIVEDENASGIENILKPSHFVHKIKHQLNAKQITKKERHIDQELLIYVKKWNGNNYDSVNRFNIRPSKIKRISTGAETRPA